MQDTTFSVQSTQTFVHLLSTAVRWLCLALHLLAVAGYSEVEELGKYMELFITVSVVIFLCYCFITVLISVFDYKQIIKTNINLLCMRIVAVILLLLALNMNISAQGYKIDIKVKGAANKNIEFAYYFGDKQFVVQQVKTNSEGAATFEGKEALLPGIYMVVITDIMFHIDFMLDDDQEFSIETDTIDPVGHLKLKGSAVNKAFFAYQDYMTKANPRIQAKVALRDSLEKLGTEEAQLSKVRDEIVKLDAEIKNKWQDFANDNPNLIIKPILIALNGEKPYQGKAGTYFFENVDFSQPALLRSPIVRETIMRVLAFNLNNNRPVPELIGEIDKLMAKAEAGDSLIYQYTFAYVMQFFSTFRRTGMNEVFVHLYDNYVLKGKANWFSADVLAEIAKKAEIMRSNYIGHEAYNFRLSNTVGDTIALHNIKTRYTLVYFWSTMCGHCKEATPHIVKFWNELKHKKNLTIVAVCTDDTDREWQKNITEKGMGDWINVIDLKNVSPFREYYSVYSTPMLFLLDKDKKIVTRRLGPEQIKELMEELVPQADKFK